MRFRQQDDSAENEEIAEKTGVSSTVPAERVGFDLPGFHNWIRVLKMSRNCLIAMTCLFLVGQGHLRLFGVTWHCVRHCFSTRRGSKKCPSTGSPSGDSWIVPKFQSAVASGASRQWRRRPEDCRLVCTLSLRIARRKEHRRPAADVR